MSGAAAGFPADDFPRDLADLHLLVGSYTATGGGNATGISVVHGTTASTVAVMDDPSFLALSGDRVYAVSETADGRVSAFRYAGGALEHRWDADAGGDAPCHVRVDPSGALVVTNYVSGTVTAVSLEAAESHAASVTASDGVVGTHGSADRVVVPESALVTGVLPDVEGPVEDRQEGPHAHQSIATPDGTVLVADLGGDALHEFRVTADPAIDLVRVHHLGPGVGPRHMAWLGPGPTRISSSRVSSTDACTACAATAPGRCGRSPRRRRSTARWGSRSSATSRSTGPDGSSSRSEAGT